MNPRPYQLDCKTAIRRELASVRSTLAVLATGLGKTCIFSWLAHEWPTGRVLVIAHREELIRQAADKLRAVTGEVPGIEMGDERVEAGFMTAPHIVVSSVQTLSRPNRLVRFDPHGFGLIIIDEAHHSVATTYRRVIDYFRDGDDERGITGNGDVRLLGVTATPKRADELAMGQVFDSCAFDYGIEPAVQDGWLVPVRQRVVKVESLDFSKVRSVAGDLNEADLEAILAEEENLHKIVAPTVEMAGDSPTLIFCVTVKHAELVAELVNRYKPHSALALSGKTDKETRREVVADFKAGKLQYLANCLDEETEILTDQGWVGIDEMNYEYHLANWDQGRVFFEQPRYVMRRERRPGERMVVLETPRRSVRVTEDHSMAYRTYRGGDFKRAAAGGLVAHAVSLPVSGNAAPLQVPVEQLPQRPVSKTRIRANSYCLRKKGVAPEEARAEATRRAQGRESLRYAEPHELTLEECEFIGFWLGDGSKSRLARGGVEYTLAQSPTCPNIVARIDWLVDRIGVDRCKRRKREGRRGDHWLWSFGRGTGFGCQSRRGLYRLEPYLVKTGTPLLWALTDDQFLAVIRGLWMADGNHGDRCEPPETLTACGVCRPLFDLLQAVAVCRGYLSTIRVQKKVARSHHTPLLRIMFRKETCHRMTKYRLRFEDGWKAERVWCVTSTSGYIFTRRRGTVTVTGQCGLFLEGFDAPSTAFVVMARPTKSLALYCQILGRGTRPLPGVIDVPGLDTAELRKAAILGSSKPFMTVLDFVGNSGKHKIVTAADVLGGKFGEPVRQYAKKTLENEGSPVLLDDALDRADAELALLSEEGQRRKRIKAQAAYQAEEVNPFAGGSAYQGEALGPEMASKKQCGYILYLSRQCGGGWTWDKVSQLTKWQAQGVIKTLLVKTGAS